MTVPDDTDRETTSDNALPDEAWESIKMQALLAEIGSRMGMRIGIPRADHAVVLTERHSNQSPVLERRCPPMGAVAAPRMRGAPPSASARYASNRPS